MRGVDGKRISILIFSFISIFFLISGVISALNYSNVLLYRNRVINENPYNPSIYVNRINGTITFNFIFKNPSPFSVDFYSITAIFEIHNITVATFQRTYYYFQHYPFQVERFSSSNLSFYVSPYPQYIPVVLNSSIINITLQMKVRFTGFSYYYENPGENYSPERYYLTEMVMMEIDWSGRV